MTTALVSHPDVPMPAGTIEAQDWEDPALTGYDQPSRYFTGTTRTVAARPKVDVVIVGIQYEDGTVERELLVHQTHADYPLTLAQARALGEAILAAVDEAEANGRHDG